MPSRVLPYPLFDADNHLYETEDALTRYLPKQYEGAIQYVQVKGRTKIAIRGRISDYIPNPTFSVVAGRGVGAVLPGGQSGGQVAPRAVRRADEVDSRVP